MRTTTRLAAIALVLLLAARGRAGTVGEVQDLAGVGARLPEAAYNSIHRTWLVVWVDYTQSGVWGRLRADDGVPEGGPFQIALGPISLFPSVTFNSTRDEWLVAYQDEGHASPVYVQRLRGADGALEGAAVPVATTSTGSHAHVAWSATSDVYLVVFATPGDVAVHARLVGGDGQPRGADIAVRVDADFSGYPAVAWGDARDEFLVTWDWDRDNFACIWGQRVDAAGELQGGPIEITTGGKQGRSPPAWDPAGQRWLVQFNDTSVPGNSFDQGGRFVNADGSLGAAVAIADTAGFEGDTILGAPVAFAAGARRYLSSFVVNTGMAVQELDAAGAKVGPQVPLAPGDFGCLGNAADPAGRRVLTVWEELSGARHVYSRLYEVGEGLDTTPPAPVSNLAAAGGDGRVTLSWTNPADADLAGTRVVTKAGAAPAGADDGVAVELAGAPGAAQQWELSPAVNGTTYHFALFAHDGVPNLAPPARAQATPAAAGPADASASAGGEAGASADGSAEAAGDGGADAARGGGTDVRGSCGCASATGLLPLLLLAAPSRRPGRPGGRGAGGEARAGRSS